MELSAQERPAKRLRMTRKTNAQTATLSVLLEGEDTDAVRAVYLVTLPHPSSEGGAAGGNLVAPGTMSREAVRDAVIACCRAPEHDPVWLRRHPGFYCAADLRQAIGRVPGISRPGPRWCPPRSLSRRPLAWPAFAFHAAETRSRDEVPFGEQLVLLPRWLLERSGLRHSSNAPQTDGCARPRSSVI